MVMVVVEAVVIARNAERIKKIKKESAEESIARGAWVLCISGGGREERRKEKLRGLKHERDACSVYVFDIRVCIYMCVQ